MPGTSPGITNDSFRDRAEEQVAGVHEEWRHSRTCASASPPPRRRRRSPRPCRWSRRPSCAARRRRPKRRGPMRSKMDAVISNIAGAAAGSADAPRAARRHRPRPGSPAAGLHGRARSVRRVQLLDRAARARAHQPPDGEGKEVKFFCVGRKGYEQLRRLFEADRRAHRSAQRSPARLRNAEDIAKKVIARFEAGEFDVCTLFFALQVGDRAESRPRSR